VFWLETRYLTYYPLFNFSHTERDSPRDQLVVTVFLILVFGLLVGAAVKGRMEQANIAVNWNTGNKRWWEVSLKRIKIEGPKHFARLCSHRDRTMLPIRA